MYNVSDSYLQEMKKQFISRRYAEMTIYNLDMQVQSSISVSSANSFLHTSAENIARVTDGIQTKLATFERDYVRADGTYLMTAQADVLTDTVNDNYITSALSVDTAVSGVYLITDNGITLSVSSVWSDGKKPITIVTDGSVYRIQLNLSYNSGSTYSAVYTMSGSLLEITDLPDGTYNEIALKIISLNKPLHRGRILRVYAGTIERYSSNDIFDASFSEINDCVGLELPEKTLFTSLVNTADLSQETEYDNPRYRKYHTQATFNLLQEVDGGRLEPIPTARWFLTSYKVNDDAVQFNWTDAIGVLNAYDHYWSSNTVKLSRIHLDEIFSIQPAPGTSYFTGRTPAQKYGIKLGSYGNIISVKNPCPVMSCSAAAQLLANVSGNRLYTARSSDIADINLNYIDPVNDIAVKAIDEIEKFSRKVESEEVISNVTVTTTQVSATTSTAEVCTSIALNQYPRLINAGGWLSSFSVSPTATISSVLYGYTMYLWTSTSGTYTVTAVTYNTTTTDTSLAIGQAVGSNIALSNPLVDGAIITAEDYANKVYRILKYNVLYSIEHRGMPELDTGDIITTDITNNGSSETVRCLVIENSWDFKGGAMSGTTKVRRLK